MDPDNLYIFFDVHGSFVCSVIVGLFPPFLIFCSPSVEHFEHLNIIGLTDFFKTRSHCVAEAGLTPIVFLPRLPKTSD